MDKEGETHVDDDIDDDQDHHVCIHFHAVEYHIDHHQGQGNTVH